MFKSPQIAAFTKPQAAKYCGISVSFLEKLVLQGKIPKCKVGVKVLFRRIDLDRFLADHVVKEGANV